MTDDKQQAELTKDLEVTAEEADKVKGGIIAVRKAGSTPLE